MLSINTFLDCTRLQKNIQTTYVHHLNIFLLYLSSLTMALPSILRVNITGFDTSLDFLQLQGHISHVSSPRIYMFEYQVAMVLTSLVIFSHLATQLWDSNPSYQYILGM